MSTLVWVLVGRARRHGRDPLRPAQPAPAPRRSASGPGSCCASSRPRSSAAWRRCRSRSPAASRSASPRAVLIYNYNDQRGLLDLRAVRRRARGAARQRPAPRPRRGRLGPVVVRAAGPTRSRRRCSRSGGCGRSPRSASASSRSSRSSRSSFLDLPSQREAWSRVLLYAMVALSLTVLTGWAGQLSLGQFAFVGLGGDDDRRARPRGRRLRPGARSSPACVTAVAAIVVGAPALRRPGLFLAVTTLAFAVMTSSWLLWRDVFLRGEHRGTARPQVLPLPAALFDEGWSLARAGHLLPGLPGRARRRPRRRCAAAAQPARPVDDRGARQRAGRRVARHLAGAGEAHRVRHRRLDRRVWPAVCSSGSSSRVRPERLPRRPSRCGSSRSSSSAACRRSPARCSARSGSSGSPRSSTTASRSACSPAAPGC